MGDKKIFTEGDEELDIFEPEGDEEDKQERKRQEKGDDFDA